MSISRVQLELVLEELEGQPSNDAEIHRGRAHVLGLLGRPAEAIEAYRQALRFNPDDSEAWLFLAQALEGGLSDQELTSLENRWSACQAGVQPSSSSPASRLQAELAFALFEALDRRHMHARAWKILQRGNALMRASIQYDVADEERWAESLLSVPRGRWPSAPAPVSGASQRTVMFIVGLPRSGSTLLESLLVRRRGFVSVGESMALADAVSATEARCGASWTTFDHEQRLRVGAAYLESLPEGDGPVIDKMPYNYAFAGLIASALPNAKVVLVERAPMDCLFGCYRRLFIEGQEWSYDLDDLARYYEVYSRVIQYWGNVLTRVRHSDIAGNAEEALHLLVGDTRVSTGSPQDGAVFDTMSLFQVEEPVSTRREGRWRNYAEQLETLRLRVEHASTPGTYRNNPSVGAMTDGTPEGSARRSSE